MNNNFFYVNRLDIRVNKETNSNQVTCFQILLRFIFFKIIENYLLDGTMNGRSHIARVSVK